MDLLPENKLIWSPVVANSRMNRERNASGINSYEQEFGFKPEIFLKEHIQKHGAVSWVDICCGKGKAVIQAAQFLQKEGLHDKAYIEGIDLIEDFDAIRPGIDFIRFISTSLTEWAPDKKYDLITCVHGLHYIGDKLKLLHTICPALTGQGLLIANLDSNSIKVEGDNKGKFVRDIFKNSGVNYSARKKIIEVRGSAQLKYDLIYKGADDKAGPNYTGQEAVNSYYSMHPSTPPLAK